MWKSNFQVSDPVGRLESFGLPRSQARLFWDLVSRWERCSGSSWTVKRLKALKYDFLRIKSGLPPLTPVRKNRKGEWYGVIGALLRFGLSSEKNFGRAISVLMCYSGFVPKAPTKEHLEKFKCSVNAPNSWIPPAIIRDVSQMAVERLGQLSPGKVTQLISYQGCPSVKSPVFGEKSVAQDKSIEKEILWITQGKKFALFSDPHSMFLNRHYRCYGPVLDGLHAWLCHNGYGLPGISGAVFSKDDMGGPFQTINSRFRELPEEPVLAGKVVPLTKDGGWKVRWIASPYRLHQLALKPIGSALFEALKELPWDGTHDQTKAIPIIQKHLQKGGQTFSVDLSSATDFFPLDIQLGVLKGLFPNSLHYVELFEELSRSVWLSDHLGQVSWTKGQPMGLYPSFASFSLTHGFLLETLAGFYRGQFHIIGDDVVILDRSLYESYLKILDVLGCPYDSHKSIVSSSLTEFGGRIITASSVVPQFKWRSVSDDNFIDFMRAYGVRFQKNLNREQRRVYRKIARFMPPLGLNHSLGKAESVVKLTAETDAILSIWKPEEKGRKFHVSFLRWLKKLNPFNRASLWHRLDSRRIQEMSENLDERVSSAFHGIPIPPLSEDLTDIFEFSGVIPDLEAVGSGSFANRKTVLQSYKELLELGLIK